MRKRFIALIACGALAATSLAGFAGCGGKKLVVWGAENQQELLEKQVKQFLEENPDVEIGIDVQICGEGDAYSKMSVDPQAGADVFAFANDQLINLYSISALAPLNSNTVKALQESEYLPALDSGMIKEGETVNYYGYPFTDNGFFLYYDSSVITAEEAKDLDSIVAACAKKGKKFIFEFENSWYALSLAYGAGGYYEVTYDGAVLKEEKTNLNEKPDGSTYSYGALAGLKLNELHGKSCVISNNGDTQMAATLNEGTFGAAVRGGWEAANVKSALSEYDKDGNIVSSTYAATILPQWKAIDGNTYDMKTFAGYKLWGVNAFSKYGEIAHRLATFLSSKAQQQIRFRETGIGPTNLELRASEDVQKDPAVVAMQQMSTERYSILQSSFPGSYWSSAESFAKEAITWNLNDVSDAKIEQRVQTLVDGLTADVSGGAQTPAE